MTALTDVLPPLPAERELRLYCFFDSEITPPDFHPEFFEPADEESDTLLNDLPKMYRVKCGKLATPHHSCEMRVHSSAWTGSDTSFEENITLAAEAAERDAAAGREHSGDASSTSAGEEEDEEQQEEEEMEGERTDSERFDAAAARPAVVVASGRVYAHGGARSCAAASRSTRCPPPPPRRAVAAVSAAVAAAAASSSAPSIASRLSRRKGKRVHEEPESEESEALFDANEGDSTQGSLFPDAHGGARCSVVARPIRQYRKRRRT